MSDGRRSGNVAEVPPAGPLCLTGRIKVEVGGEIVAETDDVALCRCGHSRNKPYCDGSHRRVGFDDPGVIQGGAVGAGSGRARQRRARHDRLCHRLAASGARAAQGCSIDGGTSEGIKGALCRCGASSTKPFCDGISP